MGDILVILILFIINGFLAMAEIAIISASRHKMNQRAKKSGVAKVALEFMDSPGEFLSTIQIGITISWYYFRCFWGTKICRTFRYLA